MNEMGAIDLEAPPRQDGESQGVGDSSLTELHEVGNFFRRCRAYEEEKPSGSSLASPRMSASTPWGSFA